MRAAIVRWTALAGCSAWLLASVAVEASDRSNPERRADRLVVRSTVVESRSPDPVQRRASRRIVDPAAEDVSISGRAWFVVESGDADFGEMLPDESREIADAFVLRIHSERDWELRLVPTGDLEVVGTTDRVPVDRLAWRTTSSQGFESFVTPAPVSVARGGPTGGAGEAITIDLRLQLGEDDPLGRYAVGFRALIEVR